MHKVLISVGLLITLLLSSISNAAGYCSGFFISDTGYIATAAHCAKLAMTAAYANGNRFTTATASLVVIDQFHDVAIIKIHDTGMNYFNVVINTVYPISIQVLGWPNIMLYGKDIKLNSGTLLYPESKYWKLNVFIAPGSSGGPVINNLKDVIGLISQGRFYIKAGTTEAFAARSEFLLRLMENINLHPVINTNSNLPSKMVFLGL